MVAARRAGLHRVILPTANAAEAAIVPDAAIVAVDTLDHVVTALRDPAADRAVDTRRSRNGLAGRVAARPGGRRRSAHGAPRARDRRRGRPSPAAVGAARLRQDDAGAAAARPAARARRRRGDRGHRHPLGGGPARPGRRADPQPPVPRAASHDLGCRAGRRRIAAPPRRGHAGAPRRPVPRRDAGVHAARPRSPPPAARRRRGVASPGRRGPRTSLPASSWSRR